MWKLRELINGFVLNPALTTWYKQQTPGLVWVVIISLESWFKTTQNEQKSSGNVGVVPVSWKDGLVILWYFYLGYCISDVIWTLASGQIQSVGLTSDLDRVKVMSDCGSQAIINSGFHPLQWTLTSFRSVLETCWVWLLTVKANVCKDMTNLGLSHHTT